MKKLFAVALCSIALGYGCGKSSKSETPATPVVDEYKTQPGAYVDVSSLQQIRTSCEAPGAPSAPASNGLVPAIGFPPGDPNATQDRFGPTGIAVPGRCPPTQEVLNARVAEREPNFPQGADLESRIRRYEITLSSLQSLSCPASSTTLLGRLQSLTALRGNPNAEAIISALGGDINRTPAG